MASTQTRLLISLCAILLLLTLQQSTATKTTHENSLLLQKLEQARQEDLPSTTNINSENDTKDKKQEKPIMVCGNQEARPNRRRKRYLITRYPDGRVNKWDSNSLTWALEEPSSQFGLAKQRRIIQESLRIWSDVSPLRFRMVSPSNRPDITFKFARRRHGPSFDPVFDGKASSNRPNIYGHAWGPGVVRSGIAGDVHIDDDDDWSEEYRLKGVIVHELGHSMGLQHSDRPDAIMFPVYRDSTELADDDIRGIQFLYGSNGRPITSRPRPATTPRPWTRRPYVTTRPEGGDRPYVTVTPKPKVIPTVASDSPCKTKTINAVVEDPFSDVPGLYYVVVEDRVHHIMYDGTHLGSSPLTKAFPGVPENPDVVFTVKETRSIIVIKDKQSWELTRSGLTKDSPKSLDHINFPEKPSYNILLFDAEGKKRRYLFGRDYWWSFYEDRPRNTPHYERRHFSRDLPQDVMFATTWSDNQLYVVSKNNYIILDTAHRTMTHDKPYEGIPLWLHPTCRAGVSTVIYQPFTMLVCLIAVVIGRLSWR